MQHHHSSLSFDPQSRFGRLIQLLKTHYRSTIPQDYILGDSYYSDVTNDPESLMGRMHTSFMEAKFENDCLIGLSLKTYRLGEFRNIYIYVREIYYKLLEAMILGLQEDRYTYRYLVLGSPGVGKSMFHAFCLYVLLQAGVPVYFVYKDYSALFFNGKTYKPLVPLHECPLLTNHNVWFLYDSPRRPPCLTDSPICLMTFSTFRIYNSYAKEVELPFYMPLWQLEELKVANAICQEYPLPHEELVGRYDLCGGIPFQIFKKYASYLKLYKKAIRKVKPRKLRSLDSLDIEDIDQTSYLLFGIVVGDDFTDYQIQFLSDRIAREVSAYWKERNSVGR